MRSTRRTTDDDLAAMALESDRSAIAKALGALPMYPAPLFMLPKPKPKPEPKGFNVDDIPPAVPLPSANSNIAVRAKQLGTEEWIEFASQREAADFTGIDPSTLSKSLRKNVPSQGWIFERVDPTIVRQYQSKPRTTGKIEGRERGTEEWTLYDTQKAAAVAAGMDPTLVHKILAGTVNRKK